LISFFWCNTQNLLELENNKLNHSIETEVVKLCDNAESMKKDILCDTKNKSGIYRWTNKQTGEM